MAVILLRLSLFSVAVASTYLAFSFSYSGWGALAWMAPPLLAVLLTDQTPRKSSIILGFYAMFCWLAITWWLAVGVNSMNSSYPMAGYLVVLTLAGLCAIPYWIAGWLCGRLGLFNSNQFRPLTAAALLTIAVDLWPARLPGTLAHCLYQQTLLVQIVDLGGTGLLSFLIYGSGFAGAAALLPSQKQRMRYALIAFLPLALTLLYGMERLGHWSKYIEQSQKLRITMVQPNLPIRDIESPNSEGNSLDTLIAQTETLLRDETRQDLIVWPEIPIYFSPFNFPENQQALDRLLAGKRTPLLLNADLFTNETVYDRVPYYNTVQLFQGSGEIKQEYRKMILVPFGEYLPLENWMTGPRWERVLAGFRRYVPGNSVTVINPLPGVVTGTPVCLEALHTDHVGEMINRGANVLINPANDAYFGTTRGAEIDFSLTVFRAIEYRIPMVRATNSGISALIDQRGIIDSDSLMTPFTADHRTVAVAPSSERKRLPPRSAGLIALSVLALLGIWRASRSSRSSLP